MKHIISKGIQDEVFVISEYGLMIQIWKIINAINSKKFHYEIFMGKIETISLFERSISYNFNTLVNMSAKRRDEPILFSKIFGKIYLIDGNHRFKKRIEDGFGYCRIIGINSLYLNDFILKI